MTTAADPSTGRPRLRRRDIAVLVILAGTSGAAVIAHAFGPVGMRYSAPFVVLPAAFVLVALILYSRGRSGQVAVLEWADRWPEILPEHTLMVRLLIVDDHRRTIILSGRQARAIEIIGQLKSSYSQSCPASP